MKNKDVGTRITERCCLSPETTPPSSTGRGMRCGCRLAWSRAGPGCSVCCAPPCWCHCAAPACTARLGSGSRAYRRSCCRDSTPPPPTWGHSRSLQWGSTPRRCTGGVTVAFTYTGGLHSWMLQRLRMGFGFLLISQKLRCTRRLSLFLLHPYLVYCTPRVGQMVICQYEFSLDQELFALDFMWESIQLWILVL